MSAVTRSHDLRDRISRSLRRHGAVLLVLPLLTVAVVHAQPAVTPAAAPAGGTAAGPPCNTCGTVIAINRVIVEGESPPLAALPQRVLERATTEGSTVSPAPPGGPRQRYEIVVRLNAGTQQVVMLDDLPKLVVGQRVRIADQAVLPDRG